MREQRDTDSGSGDGPPDRAKPRSTVRVLGSLALIVLIGGFIFVQCLRAWASSAPPRTLDIPRSELTANIPKFYALPTMGAFGTQTHGVWITLQPDGTALAFSSRNPGQQCYVGFRPDLAVKAGEGLYREACAGSTFARDGRALSGPTPRGLDRYPTRGTQNRIIVDLERIQPGPAR